MKGFRFLWTCPACGEYVSTTLPPQEEDALLVCSACGREFGDSKVPMDATGEERGLA